MIVWNRACERLTGVAAADVVGTSNHWQAFYSEPRLCLADVLAQGRADELDTLYPFHTEPSDIGHGVRAETEERRHQLLMDLSLNVRAFISQRLIPKKEGKGRTAAMEVMLNSPLISDLIFKGEVHEIKEIISRSRELGMQTFDQSLFDLHEADVISYEDALRNADSVNDLRLKIKLEGKGAHGKDLAAGLDSLGIV